jgi:predicted nucleic acid-binding protein
MPEETRVDRLFLDASVLVAASISPPGGSGYILLLGELGSVDLLVSQQVLTEARRALTRKAPRSLPEFERILRAAKLEAIPDPSAGEVARSFALIHPDDAPILAAAINARPDSLITLNTHHFIDDPRPQQGSGLTIETPATYLARYRQRAIHEAG